MIENRDWYTYRQAAARVGRAVVTIKRWVRHGLPASHDVQGRRIIAHRDLLRHLRITILRNSANRAITRDTPIYLDGLDPPTLNPPNVKVE